MDIRKAAEWGAMVGPEVITPYYHKDGITIYHADCRQLLPVLPPVDLVVTDPPYGIDYQSGRRYEQHEAIVGDEAYPVDVVAECCELANQAVYAFCRWDNLHEFHRKPNSVLTWVKNNWTAGDLEHEHGRQTELIVFFALEGHKFKHRSSDVVDCRKASSDNHPTEKPIHVVRQLIEVNEGELVLDPYMGSGSTLLAARELGRKAIGIEIEEKYCRLAVDRLSQGTLFGGPRERYPTKVATDKQAQLW